DGYRESFPGLLRDLLTAPPSCRGLETNLTDGYRESFPGLLRDLLTAPPSCRGLETNLKRARSFHA
ncbi:hypothetical protein AB4156_41040, partial [Cupriavidus sp. 2MCAB6]|uniref:hypothetical protein n=1 Tax=Cupriavidus sp. 2MCAB6 TaxID=3232981 RepID=UPI003F8ECFA7